jgi:demethylmenaquinone methyltransferase/2-methoxy-6-polyprenyl-1,4-benzoquinol methylase
LCRTCVEHDGSGEIKGRPEAEDEYCPLRYIAARMHEIEFALGMFLATSTKERYRRIAPYYDLLDSPFEYARYRRIRPRMFQGLAGRVLDAGVGTGRNLPFYPPGAEVVGVDISEAMLRRAERRRVALGVRLELHQMDVTRLDLPDNSFDAAVSTFLLCVLPEEQQTPALRELGRVVKPGGTIRLLEYVRPQGALRRALARMWEPWMAWAFGAGFDRRTEEHVPEAGLAVLDSTFVVDDLIKLLSLRVPG